jgi:hypothetical protein
VKIKILKKAVIASLLVVASAYAQESVRPIERTPSSDERTAMNTLYAEGLGAGGAYSVNYERLVLNDLGIHIGFSYWSVSASASGGGTTASASGSFIAVPITASYLGVSSGNHALELGGGITIWNISVTGNSGGFVGAANGFIPIGTAIVGYRYQPREGGFNFRVGASPLFGKGLGLNANNPSAFGVLPWGYISLGWTF